MFLKRQVDLDTAERIRALRIKGVGQDGEYKRDYPQGEMVAHLVGFTDIGHVGQEGLELRVPFDARRAVGRRRVIRDGTGQIIGALDQVREPRDGRDLRLTIDTRIQSRTFDALKRRCKDNKAQGRRRGGARRQDRRSAGAGQLAVLQPERPQRPVRRAVAQPRDHRPLRARFDAQAVHRRHGARERQVPPGSIIDAREGKLKIGRDTIRDSHRGARADDARAGVQHSSNIGTAKIALSLPPEDHWRLLTAAGFGQSPKIGFPGAAAGRLRPYKKWKPIEHATISYGHGISVSLMQMARAYTIFARQRRAAAGKDLQHRGRAARPADAGVAAQP